MSAYTLCVHKLGSSVYKRTSVYEKTSFLPSVHLSGLYICFSNIKIARKAVPKNNAALGYPSIYPTSSFQARVYSTCGTFKRLRYAQMKAVIRERRWATNSMENLFTCFRFR